LSGLNFPSNDDFEQHRAGNSASNPACGGTMKGTPKSTDEAIMADADLPIAESAYATLLDARHKPHHVAAELVRPLKSETENEAGRPHEIEIAQAEAWLAICALSKSLDTQPETDSEIWSRAISRTEEWRNILT
jgi:hypothetical protein